MWDTRKRPKLKIIGIETEVKLKSIENIFKKIIEENHWTRLSQKIFSGFVVILITTLIP